MKKVISLAIIGVFLAGCATTHEGNVAGKVGAIGGAALGAVVGHNSGDHASEGAAIGAAIGLLGGQAYGDTIGGQEEKLEREAVARQQVIKTQNAGQNAYTACVNNARAQRRDASYCRQILQAAGMERAPTTGDRRTDQLFGFRR